MSTRITVMLNSDLDKKIRHIQAKMIKESNASVSFSKALNQVLRKSLEE